MDDVVDDAGYPLALEYFVANIEAGAGVVVMLGCYFIVLLL